MKVARVASAVAVIACLCFGMAAHASDESVNEKILSQGGLKKITVPGIDLAYAMPGATLNAYTKVKLDPVEVSFAKDWNPTPVGSPFPISKSDRERIRVNAEKTVYDAFSKELKQSDYAVVDQTGTGVLGVKVFVIDLYVTQPNVMTPGVSASFAASAGQGTLVLQLYDTQSGRILARAMDTQGAQNTGRMTMMSGVENQAQADMIAGRWATILRKELDAARTIGKP